MKSNVLKSSIILLIGFGIFNFLNFLYQFSMTRLLTLSELSILAVLFSLVYIFAIFSESIQTVVARYTVLTKDDDGKLKGLLRRFFKKSKKLSIPILIGYTIIAIIFTFLLHIDALLLALMGLVLYFMLVLPINRGAMQGRKQFKDLSKNLILESGLKLIFSAIFVLLGFKIYGAFGGFVLGAAIALKYSSKPLKNIYDSNEKPMNVGNISNYAINNSFVIACLILFYSVDVVIARWLFSPEMAGTYAVASLLGKIILFASIPVSKAMFPLSVETIKGSKEDKKLLRNSLYILSFLIVLCGGMLLFSKQVITLFYGSELTGAIDILPYLVIAFSLVSFSNMILLYEISQGIIKKRYTLILTALVLVEMVLFYIYSTDLVSFAKSFVWSSAMLFVISILSLLTSRSNRHI